MNSSGKRSREIYLDHNATTYTREEVLAAMAPYFGERFGNASSLYHIGQDSKEALERSRASVASLLGARPREIVFTSGGTESDNLAIRGALKASGKRMDECSVVTSVIEHPAVLETCRSLEEDGVSVGWLECGRDGIVKLEKLEELIGPDTVVVSVMLANNETGVIQPVTDIARALEGTDILLHVDAVQGVGKIPVDVSELGVDMLSLSGHKFYGPKGIGALYIRTGTPVEAVYTGAAHEFSMRPGTENIPAIVGMSKACEISRAGLTGEMERIGKLRERMEKGILECIDEVMIVGAGSPRVPNTSSVVIGRVEGEAVVLNMSVLGFAISSGSACSTGKGGVSHVISSLGLEPRFANGAIRVSLGIRNTEEEVDAFVEELGTVVKRLRDMSPVS